MVKPWKLYIPWLVFAHNFSLNHSDFICSILYWLYTTPGVNSLHTCFPTMSSLNNTEIKEHLHTKSLRAWLSHKMKCCQLTSGKCLIALWSHLTLTFKSSEINVIKAKIHQLSICFNRTGEEGESADKIKDAPLYCSSLDNARFPDWFCLRKFPYLQRKDHEPGKMNTSESLFAEGTS